MKEAHMGGIREETMVLGVPLHEQTESQLR